MTYNHRLEANMESEVKPALFTESRARMCANRAFYRANESFFSAPGSWVRQDRLSPLQLRVR